MVKKHISSTLPLLLKYQCSKCGAQNRVQSQIRSGIFVGVLSNDDIFFEQTQDVVTDKFLKLFCRVPFNRFVDAELSCRCSSCKHTEPWARLRYRTMFVYTYISAVAVFIFSIPLFLENALWAIAPLVLSLGALAWSLLYKPIHRNMMKKQISQLNPASIPTVFYSAKGAWREIIPRSELGEDCWLCYECGEIVHNRFANCIYCGTNQGWSKAQFKNAPTSQGKQ